MSTSIEYITAAEFARRSGVSRVAVCKAIRAGRVRTNGKTGRDCRVDASSSLYANRLQIPSERPIVRRPPPIVPSVLPSAPEAPEPVTASEFVLSPYQAVRTEKIRADIETARLKNSAIHAAMLREVSDKQLELFIRAFAPVKSRLIELRLSPSQTSALSALIEGSLNEFRRLVSEWNAGQR